MENIITGMDQRSQRQSDIFLAYIRHFPGISLTYLRYLSGYILNLSLVFSDLALAYLRQLSGKSQAHLRHESDKNRHISGIICFKKRMLLNILGMSKNHKSVSNIKGRSQVYLNITQTYL